MPDTYFTVSEELRLFGLSCLMGMGLSAVYGLLRAVRLLLPDSTVLTIIGDILFLGFCTLAFSSFTSAAVRGELHMYYLIGCGCGFLLYHFTIGAFLQCYIVRLLSLLQSVCTILLLPVRKAFVAINHIVGVKFVRCAEVIVKLIKNTGLLLKRRANLLYNRIDTKNDQIRTMNEDLE
ncbi:MAG: spore cortex biosynthesis protein YabQ [Ruminococcus sp.]|nr:spore cortex biosynthesis protein YabQ [Ruminococcus sp.]